jgi:preprotein translocase subunit SecD
MKSLAELLRATDPLGYEPLRTDQQRHLSRQAVLNAPRGPGRSRSSLISITAAIALTVIGGALGSRYWPGAAVEAVAAVRFEVRLAEEQPTPGLREVVTSDGRKIYLHQETIVENNDIDRAQVTRGDTDATFSVRVTLKADGAAKMLRASQGRTGRLLAILIDGEVVSAPVIRSPISGSAVISGSYTRAEAERIVAGIVGR